MSRATTEIVAFRVSKEELTSLGPGVWSLALDALTHIEAFVASRVAGLPYAGLRDALSFGDGEKTELMGRAQAIAERHATWFAEHSDVVLFFTGLTAAHAMQLDAALRLANDAEPPTKAESRSQLFWGLLFIFTPVLLLALFYFLMRWRNRT